jgi:anti-sigma regulatory factor (Ser/Thr protein kinase)
MVDRQEYLLPHSGEAPALARRLVEEHLSPLLPNDRADDLVLMTSEMVANAVRHSPPLPEGGHQLLLERSDGAIRVAVTDGGRHLNPEETAFDTRTDGHFGMFILDRCADGWGFSLDGVKGVWFEVRL